MKHKYRRTLISILILACFACQLPSDNYVADSSDNRVEDFYSAKVKSAFINYLDSTSVKGISVAVYDHSSDSIYQYTGGTSYPGQKITKDMLWKIGSNTKTFVSVLMLKLAEDKLVSIDDEIGKYLPAFPNVDSTITIRQLLQHQSGLADIFEDPVLGKLLGGNPEMVWDPADALQYQPKPVGTPGSINRYSATNYMLAGLIIEKITDLPLHKAMRKYITGPLELDYTYFQSLEEEIGILPHPWMGDKDLNDLTVTSYNTAYMATGSLVSSPTDMVRWYNSLFNKKVLSNETFGEFTSFKPWGADNYYKYVGLGVFKMNRNGHEYYGHGGAAAGYFSFALFDLENKNAIIVMTTGDFVVAEKLSYEIAEIFKK